MTKEHEPAERVYYRSRKRIIIDNFLGGISWGVGSVIGATLVVAFIIFVLTKLQEIPFLGNLIQIILREISRQTGV